MINSTTPTEGALSLDQATSALLSAPEAQQEPEGRDDTSHAPETGAENEDQPTVETSDEGEASEVAEQPGDGEEGTETTEAAEPLDAPAYWSKDAKERFGNLPRELQEVVLAQEGPREAAAAKAKADAAEVKKTAQAQSAGVQKLAEQLNEFLPEAVQTFKQRWGEPDWEATIQQYGSEQAAILKARYDREQSQLQQLAQSQRKAQAEAQEAYVRAEWATLAETYAELAPDVNDPAKGAEKRQEVTKYLFDTGFGREAVEQISAKEMTIAHKAMLWDRAQAAAKAGKPVQSKPIARAPSSAARPSATPAASPAQRGVQGHQNAFNAKPSLDNAVALLMARS